MKLKMYFVMLAMGLLSFAMQSCSDDDENPLSVPTEIEAAFQAKFGNVAHSWATTRGGNYKASFTGQDNNKQDAYYDPQGDWLMTETDMAYKDLPVAVKTAFEAMTQYQGWEVEVDVLNRKGLEPVYVIEVEKGEEEFDLYFDANGVLWKEVPETDDDSEKYLPEELPVAVTDWLNGKYQGMKMLDAEKENNKFLEVEIMVNNKKLEVLFDENNQWVSTTAEQRVNELTPELQQVIEQLKGENPNAEFDDEVDCVETPNGIYYVIEMEIEGQKDQEIKFNEQGVIK